MSTLQLAFGETLYKVAINELAEYYESHDWDGGCGEMDCTLSQDHFNKEWHNPSPSKEELDTVVWQVIDMADIRQIGDNDVDEDTGEPHWINTLIDGLEKETLQYKN